MSEREVSRAQLLCDALEDDIVNRRLQPGERLDEVGLSERFEVSRTPVREALRQLAATGLVEVQPRRGTFVAAFGLPQIIEMFEVMAELEGMAGRLGARRIGADQKAELAATLDACAAAAADGDYDTYYYENEQFHNTIYRAAHNGFLVEQMRQLQIRLKPYRRLQLRVPKRMHASLEEHQRIVDAILAGDEDRAEQELRNHVLIQGERFTDLVSLVNHQIVDPTSKASG